MSHPHHHHHDATSASSTTILSENQKYFNKIAENYSHEDQFMRVTRHVFDAINELKDAGKLSLDEDKTRVLDYACGPGLLSQLLAPHVKEIVGMDITEGMVKMYNERVSNQGIDPSEMHCVQGDLCADDISEELKKPEYFDFDIAVCSFAFHHFPDPALAAKRIIERLRPGSGVLLLVDFRPHEDMESEKGKNWKHIVAHNGFSDENVRKWGQDAGASEVEFVEVGPKGSNGRGVTITGKHPETGEDYTMVREAFMAEFKRDCPHGSSH